MTVTFPATIIRVGLVALLAAMLAGCGSDTPSSISSPSTSPSVSLSPSPRPPVDGDGRAWPGQVSRSDFLPDALPLPSGIWDEADSGWVLATYLPAKTAVLDVNLMGPQVVYLARPDGTLYQVAELDPDKMLQIDSWTAGETKAYVRECDQTFPCFAAWSPTQILDLTTGELSPATVPFDGAWVHQTLPGGVRVWGGSTTGGVFVERDGSFLRLGDEDDSPGPLSPDFSKIMVGPQGRDWIVQARVYSMTTGEEVPLPVLNGEQCYGQEWVDSDRVIVSCGGDTSLGPGGPSDYDPENPYVDTRVYQLVTLSTGEAVETEAPSTGPDETGFWGYMMVEPDVWAGWLENSSSPFGIMDHGVLRELAITCDGEPCYRINLVAAINGGLYFQARRYQDDDSVLAISAESIIVYDLATDTQITLIPEPPVGPSGEMAIQRDVWLHGLVSWMIAS